MVSICPTQGVPLTVHICRETQPKKSAQLATTTNTLMWVDRYRPSRFTELLGDDRVHREVLSWVKEWDSCVFGKNKNRGRKRARDDENGENVDQWRRPQEKVGWHSFSHRIQPRLICGRLCRFCFSLVPRDWAKRPSHILSPNMQDTTSSRSTQATRDPPRSSTTEYAPPSRAARGSAARNPTSSSSTRSTERQAGPTP